MKILKRNIEIGKRSHHNQYNNITLRVIFRASHSTSFAREYGKNFCFALSSLRERIARASHSVRASAHDYKDHPITFGYLTSFGSFHSHNNLWLLARFARRTAFASSLRSRL